MLQGAGKENEEGEEQDGPEMANSLFFMAPDCKGIRDMEDQEVRDYWEAGITSKCLSALKSGDIDHSRVLCYHCSRWGYITANWLARKSASTRPWRGRAGQQPRKGWSPRPDGRKKWESNFIRKVTGRMVGKEKTSPWALQSLQENF